MNYSKKKIYSINLIFEKSGLDKPLNFTQMPELYTLSIGNKLQPSTRNSDSFKTISIPNIDSVPYEYNSNKTSDCKY